MATMITEVYEAFRKVGIPDPEAKQAAEALSAENVSTKADINGAEKSLMAYIGEVEKKLGERISREVAALDDKLSDTITALDEKFSREIADIKASIAKQDRKMAVMQWMLGTTIAGILSLIAGVASIAIKLFF